MFHKEGSSLSSSNNGKKYKDVTLRKSDRKHLFQSVLHFFHLEQHPHPDDAAVVDASFHPKSEESITNNTGKVDGKSNETPSSLLLLLEDIFVRNGDIYERTITKWTVASFITLNETCVVNVHQYYRSPSTNKLSSLLSSSSSSSSDITTNHFIAWPYSLYTQCVWMKIDIVSGDSTTMYDIPGMALLSVLPPSLYAPYVTHVPSPLSEYICTNGVKHIMRVGLRSLPVTQQEHQKIILSYSPSTKLTKPSLDRKIGITTIVCVQGNPQPICVGILHPDLMVDKTDVMHSTNTVPLFGPGCPKGGIGVSVVHAYGDDIWRQQIPTSKEIDKIQPYTLQSIIRTSNVVSPYIQNPIGQSLYDLGHYGNIGFIDGKYVNPITIEQQQQLLQQQEEEDKVSDLDNVSQVEDAFSDLNVTPLENLNVIDAEDADNDDRQNNDNSAGISLPNQAMDESDTNNEHIDTVLSPDEILHDAVCRALAKINIKKDLPITMATFYAQFVLPNRKDGTTIQLKQTRYKKFSTYVKEQVDDALLLVGKHVSGNNAIDPMGMLIGFDRKHPDVVPYLIAQKEETTALAEAGTTIGVQKRLEIADLYCVPNHYVALLQLDPSVVKAINAKTEERRGTGMLTAKEVRAILDDYIVKEGLIDANQPDTVKLNGPLTDALYKKKTKKSTTGADVANGAPPTPLTLQRKELVKLWMACQESAYALVQVPGNKILRLKRGKPPTITIEVSRRQSNKYVTTVIGLELYDISLSEFAKDVANRFACASSIDTDSTSAATDVVVVQGNLSVEIEALLLSDETLTGHGGVKGSTYFLPKNSINIVLKKGVPARKKNQSKK